MPEKTSPAKPARAKAVAKATPEKTTEGERIAKVLSRAGVSSRREAERLIEAGEVTVNGKIITSAALNVTGKDKITVSGQPVGAPDIARLWLYYKPEGLVTSASDEKGRDTVFDHLPEDMPRVMSVGRLDLNSEGLLLLTNDGALKRQLELPSTGWLRKYRVRVKGNPTDPDLEPLRKGITVEGERFQPMDVRLDRHQGANAWLTVGLREGKNREIRRAMMAIGLTVNRLIRISYGPFRLNEMNPGDVEEVRTRILKDQLGALLEGGVDPDDDEAPARPTRGRTGVRTTSRSGAGSPRDEGARPVRKASPPRDEEAPRSRSFAARRAEPEGRSDAKPSPRARDAEAPRGRAAQTRATESGERPARKTAAGKAQGAQPGKVTSAKGRAALGTLSDAWSTATTPRKGPVSRRTETAEKPAPQPHRGQKGTGPRHGTGPKGGTKAPRTRK
jgi:23S rRNA pseudouridine2605 synthase